MEFFFTNGLTPEARCTEAGAFLASLERHKNVLILIAGPIAPELLCLRRSIGSLSPHPQPCSRRLSITSLRPGHSSYWPLRVAALLSQGASGSVSPSFFGPLTRQLWGGAFEPLKLRSLAVLHVKSNSEYFSIQRYSSRRSCHRDVRSESDRAHRSEFSQGHISFSHQMSGLGVKS